MKAARLAMILALALVSQACVVVDDSRAVLTVDNRSSYVLDRLFLTPVNAVTWGPDLLRGTALYPGEYVDIYDIRCDYYDVMVVDEYGAECVLEAVDLCFSNQVWTITDNTLRICDRFGSL